MANLVTRLLSLIQCCYRPLFFPHREYCLFLYKRKPRVLYHSFVIRHSSFYLLKLDLCLFAHHCDTSRHDTFHGKLVHQPK